MNPEQRRAQTRLDWQKPFPEPTPEEQEELAEFSAMLEMILPTPQRTPDEEAAFRQEQLERYERKVQTPLPFSDAITSTRAENREVVAATLQSWPVRFRAKELDSGFVSSWQDGFEFDSNEVRWPERAIAWEKLQWIELDASALNENEQQWLRHVTHELRAAQSWSFPPSLNRCCFDFHFKSWEADERDGARAI